MNSESYVLFDDSELVREAMFLITQNKRLANKLSFTQSIPRQTRRHAHTGPANPTIPLRILGQVVLV